MTNEIEIEKCLKTANEKLTEFINGLNELDPYYDKALDEVKNDNSLSEYQRAIKLSTLRSSINKACAPSGDTLKAIGMLASLFKSDESTGTIVLNLKNDLV